MTDAQVIRSPLDGTEWRIGELVGVRDTCGPYTQARIVGIAFDGSWDPNARDVDSVWLALDDRSQARPRILEKLAA